MKKVLIPLCIALAVVFLTVAAVLIVLNRRKGPAYVTNYPFEINEINYIERGGWTITKRQFNTKGTFLEISTNKQNGGISEYSYEVYDTEEQARAAYEEWYRATKSEHYVSEEGSNWFKGEMPYVSDATIHAMFYVEGNVVIIAELSCYSEWNGNSHDYSYREKYLVEHAPEIKDAVLDLVSESER